MYLFLFLILGLVLRLINIDKPEGLWNDEYVSWFIASTPFIKGFWAEVLKQCHLPLYYLYLKPFASCNDIVLRLTSVLPSMMAVYIMFLIGNFFSKKDAYICAGLTATLPFLVYYSQEVRFYSLVFFFSALLLFYLLKIIYKDKGWVGFIISSVLIMFTHVLGGIYVGLSTCYLLYKKKKIAIKAVIFIGCIILLVLPFGINILKMIPSSQWWGNFSYTNILFLFSDYFSPILTNNINAPSEFFYNKNLIFSAILLIPTLIAVLFIAKGALRAKGLFLIFFLTVFIFSILSINGIIVFITKYTIEIFPILILLFSLGICSKINYLFGLIYLFIILFSIYTPFYSSKIPRSEGHNLAAQILNQEKLDKIVFTYYEPNRFYRYLKNDAETSFISKINRFEYLNHPEKILDNVKTGEKVAIVFLDSVSFIPENYIETAKEKMFPEMFISFSIIRQELEKEFVKNYGNKAIYKNGSWIILIGKKLK